MQDPRDEFRTIIGRTECVNGTVSTIGMNFDAIIGPVGDNQFLKDWFKGDPQFETAIADSSGGFSVVEKYFTREEAEAGHEKYVNENGGKSDPDNLEGSDEGDGTEI